MQLFSSAPRNMQPIAIPTDIPVYKVGDGKFYCDDELLIAGTIIAYSDEPNPEFIPLNEMAMEKMREYLTKLDNLGRRKAEKDGVAFISSLDAFEQANAPANQDNRRAMKLGGTEEKPILGGQRRGRPRVNKIEVQETPEVVVVGKKTSERDAVNATSDTGLGKK